MSLVKVRADPWELVAPTRLLTRRDGFVVGQMGPRRQLDANDMPTTMAARQCLWLVVDMTRGHRQTTLRGQDTGVAWAALPQLPSAFRA